MTTPSTPLYREIQLTQGQVALVSAHRFQELSAYKWYAHSPPIVQRHNNCTENLRGRNEGISRRIRR